MGLSVRRFGQCKLPMMINIVHEIAWTVTNSQVCDDDVEGFIVAVQRGHVVAAVEEGLYFVLPRGTFKIVG